MAAALLVAICVGLLWLDSHPSAQDLYGMMAEGDPPASFRVVRLERRSAGLDADAWVEFSIEPADLATMLEQGEYTPASADDWATMGPPSW